MQEVQLVNTRHAAEKKKDIDNALAQNQSQIEQKAKRTRNWTSI